MTEFIQSLSNGDWVALTATAFGALELMLLSAVAWIGRPQ